MPNTAPETPGSELVPVWDGAAEVALRSPDLLDAEAAELVSEAPSENTLRAYRRWAKHYEEWCADRGVPALPGTAQTFANYVTALTRDDKGVPTIRIAMAAVRWVHALAGHKGNPPSELALLALRAYRKRKAGDGVRTRKATPILLPALRLMLDACPPDTLRGRRDRALFVLGWSGMFRRSEIAALSFTDIRVDDEGVTIYVAQSKTDKDAKGAEVPIPHGTHPETDPAQVLAAYTAALAGHGITSGRLFRGIDRRGAVTPEMTGDQINAAVKGAARRAGLPDAAKYSAHSLRAGGATAAYRAGAPVATIASHGRWAENSPVVLGYIRSVDKWKDNPMRGIGL